MVMIASSMLLLSLVSMVRHHALLSLAPFQRLLHKVTQEELQNLPTKVLCVSLCAYIGMYILAAILLGIFIGVKDALTSPDFTVA